MPWALGMFVIFWEICQLYIVSDSPHFHFILLSLPWWSPATLKAGVTLKSRYIRIGSGS